MFTVYHSNDVHVLKTLVVELMARQPLSGAFDKETILVQSPGMSQWLKLQIAEHFGIAANIDFPLPATFVWNIFKEVLDDVPKRSAFSKEQMTWRLLEIIPEFLTDPAFDALASYLKNDDRQVKLYQLSARIADIFDQYLMYRPQWINQWETGQLVDELKREDLWQATLWQALSEHTLASGASEYHRANLYDGCIAKLASGVCPSSIKQLKRIFIFGISALPPRYLQVLEALGQHIDVHFMLFNPCQFYWGDILDQKYLARIALKQRRDFYSGEQKATLKASAESYGEGAVGNSLLASWGKVGRDMQRLLSDQSASEVEAFVPPGQDSLLSLIKNDMLLLNDAYADSKNGHKRHVRADDDSISLNVCHSAMREVEALHDYLLDVFSNDPDIQPRDVVVMVSDIDAYSPYIHAVFSSQPDSQRIPFSISDLSSNHYHSIIQAYIWLLGVHQHRFSSTELLAFIQVPAVMKKFGIKEEDLDLIAHWIQDAGIRWGLDEETARSFDLPEMVQNTWLFGLERMLSGYALSETLGVVDEVLPYDQIQGLNAELAGKLAYLIQQLIQLRQQLMTCQQNEPDLDDDAHTEQNLLITKLSVPKWKELLERIRIGFFKASDEADQRQLQQIADAIGNWYSQLEETGLLAANESSEEGLALTSEVILEVMSEKLIQERISQRFLAGQLNFCTLMPMRSVPFKVVCLLGMDGNAYPRQQPPLGFDLMHGRFEYGDRSRRDDDRYLFLEAVLSAEKYLYLSYTGRSIRDNSERIPSILISELMDYCTEGFYLEGTEESNEEAQAEALLSYLTTEHSLTPYSTKAFHELPRHSYASQWYEIAKLGASDDTNVETDRFLSEALATFDFAGVLDLQELIQFWASPIRYFFHKRLKVHLLGSGDVIEEDERFTLDGLQKYQLKQQLADWALEQQDLDSQNIETVLDHFQAKGTLPAQGFGELELMESYQLVIQLTSYLGSLPVIDKDQAVEIDLAVELDSKIIHLEAWLPNFTGQSFIHYRVGQLRGKDVFSLWINHLASCSEGVSMPSSYVGVNAKKKEIEHLGFLPLEKCEAKHLLDELTSCWWQGMHSPLLFNIDWAQSYLSELEKPKSDEQSAKRVLEDVVLASFEEDEYLSRCWPEPSDQQVDELIELIERIYLPMSNRLVSFFEPQDGGEK
ncbi:exodeoxyribonuclease V subunit gamma [Litoribrevibacter albus]|uniref:RecBCD enzyme subunit RecC n=1 Tax=Litoribrevibacter albus TaxID=1473156 RepID=A0AA37SB53_9GAMM|nr:exodeoxyribonuclease V subunit gamma [Litoribrevibacter albus]GLQ31763.1 RecBCD enzyme subunit RecC [Litoribrevibacter albus]